MGQYRMFVAQYGIGEIEQCARTADSPVISTNWFQAVAYCNWLSKQEGLPQSEWCYEPVQDPGRIDPEFKGGMKLAQDYLQRKGYRLPTEAEMEYATRAGAATSRYFGETEDLLEKYSLYQRNSEERAWPVGSKKPNDFGLFDMHGNASTWCQERYKSYPKSNNGEANEDTEDSLSIEANETRVVRGGSFSRDPASHLRSAHRTSAMPSVRSLSIGFRVAKTFQ